MACHNIDFAICCHSNCSCQVIDEMDVSQSTSVLKHILSQSHRFLSDQCNGKVERVGSSNSYTRFTYSAVLPCSSSKSYISDAFYLLSDILKQDLANMRKIDSFQQQLLVYLLMPLAKHRWS